MATLPCLRITHAFKLAIHLPDGSGLLPLRFGLGLVFHQTWTELQLLLRYGFVEKGAGCQSYRAQSSGGVWTPQMLPRSSSANPSNQSFSYSPIRIQFTTRAVTAVLVGRPSIRTAAPISSGRRNRATHPCGFTRSVRHDSENG